MRLYVAHEWGPVIKCIDVVYIAVNVCHIMHDSKKWKIFIYFVAIYLHV